MRATVRNGVAGIMGYWRADAQSQEVATQLQLITAFQGHRPSVTRSSYFVRETKNLFF